MNIQWFPGHMAKAFREASANVKQCNLVIELLDARIPLSSQNPEACKTIGEKPRIVVLNKADMADPVITAEWIAHFAKQKILALPINSHKLNDGKKLISCIYRLLKDKIQADRDRGIKKDIRIMVLGIPNVGKSSLLNCLVKKKTALVGDRPGVTKANRWIKLGEDMLLLDTPGILWPKFDNIEAAKKLALTGAVKDSLLDMTELCKELCEYLYQNYKDDFFARYKLEDKDFPQGFLDGYQLMEIIAKKRGFILAKGLLDLDRGSKIIIDEFRGCKIARVCLERSINI